MPRVPNVSCSNSSQLHLLLSITCIKHLARLKKHTRRTKSTGGLQTLHPPPTKQKSHYRYYSFHLKISYKSDLPTSFSLVLYSKTHGVSWSKCLFIFVNITFYTINTLFSSSAALNHRSIHTERYPAK